MECITGSIFQVHFPFVLLYILSVYYVVCLQVAKHYAEHLK
jgi:hypothetical protein